MAAGLCLVLLIFAGISTSQREEAGHRDRDEAELVIGNLSGAAVSLFLAGRDVRGAELVDTAGENTLWLPPGRYYLKATTQNISSFYPASLLGYRTGPNREGAYTVTIRTFPLEQPPKLDGGSGEWRFIPAGNSLFGDYRNPKEAHYVWLTGFFIAPFEVTNREFQMFLSAPDGYADDTNWTEAGVRWRSEHTSNVSSLLPPDHPDAPRFGQPDQPITWVNWFEADAFCHWLTRIRGNGKWWFSLPNEAEWEKAARGPDGLDFSLSMQISDQEMHLYNWKKNPIAAVTVIGIDSSATSFSPNRYGLYHMTGNVVEWTQSVFQPFNRDNPFRNDRRNHREAEGLRVARGGSWYSGSIAYMYIPYRDAFQPEHSTQDVGFRLVARPLP